MVLAYEGSRSGPGPVRVLHRGIGAGDRHLHRGLRAENIRLTTCADSSELVEQAIRRPPDLVLYELEEITDEALGVLRLLRRVLPRVPIVITTRSDSLTARRRLLRLRPAFVAVRPFAGHDLVDLVRAFVEPGLRDAG